MNRLARIKDKIFMDVLPGVIALVVMVGMLGGVMFIVMLPYLPK